MAALLTLILSAPPAPLELPVVTDARDPRLAGIATTVVPFVDARMLSGAVVSVANKGGILGTAAVGWADLEAGRAMKTDTPFWVASITKPMTAAAFLTLVDSGSVRLDDPVADYLPEFSGYSTPPVTVRQMITHTSGLQGNVDRSTSVADQVEKLAKNGPAFPPGTKWKYGDGLAVCGRIAEAVTDQPYVVFMQERLFDPLGMEDSTFVMTNDYRNRLAEPYALPDFIAGVRKEAGEYHQYLSLDVGNPLPPHASGGLFSTAPDIQKFARMLIGGGEVDGVRILEPETVAEMLTVQTPDLTTGWTPGNGWGLGICLVREPQLVTRSLSPGSYGHGGVYGPQLWVDKERGLSFLMMICRSDLRNGDGSDFREAFQVGAARMLEAED